MPTGQASRPSSRPATGAASAAAQPATTIDASTAAASLYVGVGKHQGFSLRRLALYVTVLFVCFVLAVNWAYTLGMRDVPQSKGALAGVLSRYQQRAGEQIAQGSANLTIMPTGLTGPPTKAQLEAVAAPSPQPAMESQEPPGITVAEMRRQGTYVLHLLRMRLKRSIDDWRKLPRSDPSHSQMWDSCAIVGNSGAMLGQGRGAEIDGHTMVMRLNNSPTRGHEDDVGAKTTVSLINGWRLHWCGERPMCPCWPYGLDVALMAYIWEPFMADDIRRCLASHPGSLILAVEKELEALANRIAREYTARRFEALTDPAEKRRMREERQRVKLNFST
eukprot:jgi/Tetstr1/428782/TSEL_018769.t1